MHATDVKAIEEATRKEVGPAEKDSAARLTALMHNVFLLDIDIDLGDVVELDEVVRYLEGRA